MEIQTEITTSLMQQVIQMRGLNKLYQSGLITSKEYNEKKLKFKSLV